jgi:hypothetical protein
VNELISHSMAPSNCTQKAVNSNYGTRSKDMHKFSTALSYRIM